MRASWLFAIILAICAAAPAGAATTFVATLNGTNNVPPLPGVTATGTAILILNDAQTELSYTIEYSGLSSPEIASHIHNAGPRDNGPIAHALPPSTPKIGVWQIPNSMVVELFAGRLYMNIHSDDFPSGEIRGNISEQQVPVESLSFGAVKARYR